MNRRSISMYDTQYLGYAPISILNSLSISAERTDAVPRSTVVLTESVCAEYSVSSRRGEKFKRERSAPKYDLLSTRVVKTG